MVRRHISILVFLIPENSTKFRGVPLVGASEPPPPNPPVHEANYSELELFTIGSEGMEPVERKSSHSSKEKNHMVREHYRG